MSNPRNSRRDWRRIARCAPCLPSPPSATRQQASSDRALREGARGQAPRLRSAEAPEAAQVVAVAGRPVRATRRRTVLWQARAAARHPAAQAAGAPAGREAAAPRCRLAHWLLWSAAEPEGWRLERPGPQPVAESQPRPALAPRAPAAGPWLPAALAVAYGRSPDRYCARAWIC